MPPEVFVTGLGAVTPAGCGVEASWSFLLAGHRAVRPVAELKQAGCATTFAGQVPNFVPPTRMEQHDRLCQLAVAAADEAVASAGLHNQQIVVYPSKHIKVSLGTSKGGLASFTSFLNYFVSDYNCSNYPTNTLMDIPPDAPARQVAARFGLTGGIHVPVSACTTGTHAVIRGAQMIEDGDADMVICGGADASLHPLWLAAFERMGVLAAEHPDRGPSWACRPFDHTRDGFAVGEGAAVLVLESNESVAKRKVQPIARIAGFATGSEPTGLIRLGLKSESLVHVIQLACTRAGYKPAEITCIHAHGTGTPANDLLETRAIRKVLGVRAEDVPIISIKGAIGHLLGGAGAVEITMAVLSCRDRICPGTATLIEPDPRLGRLLLPKNTFRPMCGPVMKTSLGFGGHVAAIVIAPV